MLKNLKNWWKQTVCSRETKLVLMVTNYARWVVKVLWSCQILLISRIDSYIFSAMVNPATEKEISAQVSSLWLNEIFQKCFFKSEQLQTAVHIWSLKMGVSKNFEIFTGKHIHWSLFLIKLQVFRKKETPTHLFSCEYCGICKNFFFI